jgi:hypothetical protein
MRYYSILKHLPFVFAVLWSIGASIYLLISPTWMTVYTSNGDVSRISRYEAEGPRIIYFLVIFTLLFSLTPLLAIKGRYIALAVVSLTATGLTILASFSVGGYYFYAVLGVAVGWILILLEWVVRAIIKVFR